MLQYYLKAIELNNSNAMFRLGSYYRSIKKYDDMMTYLMMAIELKNSDAMCELAIFYGNFNCVTKGVYDFNNMIKYYLMSIELNNSTAMYKLGLYYKFKNAKNTIEHKNNIKYKNNMEKYFLMASEFNEIKAIIELCEYYYVNNNYDKMIKYCLIGIEINKSYPIFSNMLGKYYKNIHDHHNTIKYFVMAIEFNDSDSAYELGRYYKSLNDTTNMIKYFVMSIEFNSSIKAYDSSDVLAKYYKHIKDYYNMAKYLLISFEKYDDPDIYSVINLWKYYKFKKDTVNEYKYFIYCVAIDVDICILEKYISHIEIYNYLVVVFNKIISDDIDECIYYIKYYTFKNYSEEHKKDKNIKCAADKNMFNFTNKVLIETLKYKNKGLVKEYLSNKKIYSNKLNIANKKNIIDECCICYENNLQMQIGNCCHTVCTTCYPKIQKCPLCNGEIC